MRRRRPRQLALALDAPPEFDPMTQEVIPARASWPCRNCALVNPAVLWTCQHCGWKRRRRTRPTLEAPRLLDDEMPF